MQDEAHDLATTPDGALARQIMRSSDLQRGAEAELCRRFLPRVRAYGQRHLGSQARADDLVQRVLTLVIEKLRAGAVNEPDRIGSYVLGVARLTAKESFRDGRKTTVLDDAASVPVPEGGGPGDVFGLDRLPDCLARLSERERAAVVLSYYEDRDAEHIARLWGTTPGNVRVIRHRALLRLRSCVRGREEEA